MERKGKRKKRKTHSGLGKEGRRKVPTKKREKGKMGVKTRT